jgi:DNA-binding CsgD family transcriptional regulator
MLASARLDLIGRTSECRVLEDLARTVRDGHSRVLVVRGEAGTGKSALLQHLVDAASGFRTVHVSGVESEMELPFGALHQLCAPMLDRVDVLADPQRDAISSAFGLATGNAPDRLLIGIAVLNLLSAASADAPLLCVVDDAQWLDRASTQALTFVARRLLAEPIALVFATRQPDGDLGSFPQLVVDGLDDVDALKLLNSVLHVPLDPRVRSRVIAETHGNPLALIDWPRGRTPTELAGGFGMSTALSMSGQLEENYRRRLAELPAATQQFLLIAAAEPTGDAAVVSRAAKRLWVDWADAAPAVQEGLLEIGVQVRFRHPLVRSAAYNSAVPTDRQAAHRALAEETDAELDPDRRAWHSALGACGPDEKIAEALEQSAARAKARGGFAAAAALLERAAALSEEAGRAGKRTLTAATAHHDAGSYEIAGRLVASAEAARLDAIDRAELEMLRGRLAMATGEARDAPRLLLRAAQQFDPLDVQIASAAYLHATASMAIVGNLAKGVSVREVARAATSRPSSPQTSATEWLVEGLAHAMADELQAAAPLLRRALKATETVTEPNPLLPYYLSAAWVLWDGEAMHRLSLVLTKAMREIGALTMLPWVLNTHALLVAMEGELERAQTMTSEAAQIVEITGGSFIPAVDAMVVAYRGSHDAAEYLRGLAERAGATGYASARRAAQWAGATLFNAAGHYEQALELALEAHQQGWAWSFHLRFPELVEAAARCGRADIAQATLEQIASTVVPSGSDWGRGVYCRSKALLCVGAAADELYSEAIERLTRTTIRSELARAHLHYGEWLRREGRRIDARAQLRAAHDSFTEMGMGAFAERARRELAATGATVRKRVAEARDALTPQEAHIAQLAADGLTNPEIAAQLFISHRTVEFHLRKVFTKLGVTSRRQLRDVLPRLRRS